MNVGIEAGRGLHYLTVAAAAHARELVHETSGPGAYQRSHGRQTPDRQRHAKKRPGGGGIIGRLLGTDHDRQ